jgi:hypothetical protein
MNSGCLSRGLRRPGRGVDHPPSSSAEVKQRIGLYLLLFWTFMDFCGANFTFTINTQHAILGCDIVFRWFVVIPPIGRPQEKVQNIPKKKQSHYRPGVAQRVPGS